MASLIQSPGGKKNRGGYGTGNFRVRLVLPNSKKTKTFCTGTSIRKIAERFLDRINNIEKMAKAENGAIIALYRDLKGDNGLIVSINEELGIEYKITILGAIDDYIKDCELRVSMNTVKSYKLALKDLCGALKGSTKLLELTKTDYSIILKYLSDRYNGTTVNIRLRGLRAFLHWLVENEYISRMPFKVKQIKLKERLPQFMTPQELKLIYENTTDPLLVSHFKVYEGTGMRLSELKTSQLEGSFIRVIGKGNKERLIPLPSTLVADFQIAIAADYKTDRISRGFTTAKRNAKISGDKRLHSLRHTYALKKLLELGDMHLVQKLLGHSSISVTEIYTKFPKEYLKEVFKIKIG